MGIHRLSLKMPPSYSGAMLREAIGRKLGLKDFSYEIEKKSLDARKKSNIHWLINVQVYSPASSQAGFAASPPALVIPYRGTGKKVLVCGSGPAGFFAAWVLQQAGFQTTIIERGAEVENRAGGISKFEKHAVFSETANYAFGEGGAGTFSDGKLTSRSKHISREKDYILHAYIRAGAPEEIAWLAHPHLGTDTLRRVVKSLRMAYLEAGGSILFETRLLGIESEKGRVKAFLTDAGDLTADYFFLCTGHSAFDTYRMLMQAGLSFRTKNFALGARAEHKQAAINRAQWGVESLSGVKAAEYRLRYSADGKPPVYTFCMCPGGIVVPATAFAHTNIVNGMSYYRRSGRFANAACVAGLHPDDLAGRSLSPAEALDHLEALEMAFCEFGENYQAPACRISSFLHQKMDDQLPESSYPLGLKPAPLWQMLPGPVTAAIQQGLRHFSRQIPGYDQGLLLGLESKTSSPVQVLRHEGGLCVGFDNLWMCGEGSGYAGGIISSGADGLRAALALAESH